MSTGALVISLDFELYWGMRDVVSEQAFLERAQGTRDAVKGMLCIFQEFQINATWATVGLLALDGLDQLAKYQPRLKPNYENELLNNYREFGLLDESTVGKLYFAPELVGEIASTPGQEIGSHTFSHYYTNEAGQTYDSFIADLEASSDVWGKYGLRPRAIVFPRNQINTRYLAACADHGYTVYRGNPASRIYDADFRYHRSPFMRAFRLVDGIVNMSGHHLSMAKFVDVEGRKIVNVPASRFLRPCGREFSNSDRAKVGRIKAGMLSAARRDKLYHLWWHPHNFGSFPETNLKMLREILVYFRELENRYSFRSYSMTQAANTLYSVQNFD